MLEQLFGSKTRVKVMKIFLENPEKRFYVRELTRLTDSLINSIRRELANLVEVGFLVIEAPEIDETDEPSVDSVTKKSGLNKKKYFRLNKGNVFLKEFDALFSKGKFMLEKKFTDQILKCGEIRYIALSGIFIDKARAATDMVVIGNKINKKKIINIIKTFEQKIDREINYTVMDMREFKLRKDIADRFLNDIIQDKDNIVLLDELHLIENV